MICVKRVHLIGKDLWGKTKLKERHPETIEWMAVCFSLCPSLLCVPLTAWSLSFIYGRGLPSKEDEEGEVRQRTVWLTTLSCLGSRQQLNERCTLVHLVLSLPIGAILSKEPWKWKHIEVLRCLNFLSSFLGWSCSVFFFDVFRIVWSIL